MRELSGAVALVTGAGRGVGRVVALRLAREGTTVAALARTAAELESAEEEAAREGCAGRLVPFVTDVSRPREVEDAVNAVRREIGPVDLLVNNAAIYLEKPIVETSPEEWQRVLAVNALGPFLLARLLLADMLRRDNGRIINICSTASHIGYARQSAYVASKHALLGFTKVLAAETQGTNIRVHAVSPGGINTTLVQARPGVDLSEYMSPDEIADIVLFLARTDDTAIIDEVVVRRKGSTPFRC